VAEALSKMLDSKKSEELADETGHISATQVEYMHSRLKRLERNILVRRSHPGHFNPSPRITCVANVLLYVVGSIPMY